MAFTASCICCGVVVETIALRLFSSTLCETIPCTFARPLSTISAQCSLSTPSSGISISVVFEVVISRIVFLNQRKGAAGDSEKGYIIAGIVYTGSDLGLPGLPDFTARHTFLTMDLQKPGWRFYSLAA